MASKRRTISKHEIQALTVLAQFRLIFGSVRQHFRDIEKICGVSGSQLWILREADMTPGVGVSEVAERLSIHQSTCSQLVEKLVARRLLKKARSSDDQRRVGLNVTVLGRRALDCAPGPAQGLLPEALASMPGSDLRSLARSLAKVIDELDVTDAKSAERPLADL